MISPIISILILGQVLFADDLESILSGENLSTGQRQAAGIKLANPDLMADTLKSQMNAAPTAEQSLFFDYLMSRKYAEALIAMAHAFGHDAQMYTPNLKAVRSYLLFRSGLRVTGIEELFSITSLNEVHFYILNRWREILPKHDDSVWIAAQFDWNSEFTKVFGTTLEARVGLVKAQIRSDINKLKDLNLKVMDKSSEKTMLYWSMALAHLAVDQNQEAAKLISVLLKDASNQVPRDAIYMTAARMLFQAGSFDGAINYYKKIPKKSDLWMLAQEELAWSYLRRGEPQNAMAIGITITNPMFKGWVGSEAFLVAAIGSLRVCDYPEVVRALDRFSTQFKPRLKALYTVAEGDLSHADIQSLISDIKNSPLTGLELTKVGPRIHRVPHLMVTNRSIREWLKADLAFEQEMQKAELLFTRSMTLNGLQSQFEVFKNQILTKKNRNFKQVQNLIQNLAARELEQIKQTLAKMHIIEAELLTHVSIADRLLAGNTVKDNSEVSRKVGTTGSQDKFSVKFEMTDELWFDEIGSYKVDVKKACQQKKAESQ